MLFWFKKKNITVYELIKTHSVAVVLAIISGLILMAPPLIFRSSPVYQGIDFFGTDGESSYIAQVHAVYNGDFSFGNVFLFEYKDQPYVKQPLPAIITAALGKMFFLSVPNAIILAKFVFPVITFIFIYGLFLTLTKDQRISYLGALFIILAPGTTAWLDPNSWLSVVTKGVFMGSDPQFLFFSRPISPQVSNLFFFAYLATVWMALTKTGELTAKKQKWLEVGASLLLGLTFYTYLFAYTLLFAMNGFLALYFLLTKDFRNFKKICVITGGGLIVGVPYFINMVQVFASPYAADLSVRVGQVHSREFIFSRLWLGVALVLAFYRKRDWFFAFSVSFLAAIFAVSNQQIITGRTIPIPEHYHWYYMAPIGGFIIMRIIFNYLQNTRTRLYLPVMFSFLVIFFLGSGVLFQAWSYRTQFNYVADMQVYGPAMEWLRNNTSKEDSVFAGRVFSEQIVVFTSANVYYSRYAGDALVPVERLRRAYYTYMYLDGVTNKDATNYFSDKDNRARFSNQVFSNYWRAKNGCYECYPAELDQNFITEYQSFYQRPFLENLFQYHVTYAVWDKKLDPNWKLERFFNEAVFDDGRVRIYRVTK